MPNVGNIVPPKLLEQIYADHGRDWTKWPEELRDIFDPSIAATPIAPPSSGKIKTTKETGFHYHWAKDVCGSTPDHTRVEELRSVGWDYATTDDVVMYNEFTVKNRRNGKPDGFSNEIRNGDLRLMKVPMALWRAKRKAENTSAYQMAYPQVFGTTGKPMTAGELTPGLKTEMVTGENLPEFESRFKPENSATMIIPKVDD